MDADSDGTVCFGELENVICGVEADAQSVNTMTLRHQLGYQLLIFSAADMQLFGKQLKALQGSFADTDASSDVKITPAELEAACKKLGLGLNSLQRTAVFAALGSDGTIGYAQLEDLVVEARALVQEKSLRCVMYQFTSIDSIY